MLSTQQPMHPFLHHTRHHVRSGRVCQVTVLLMTAHEDMLPSANRCAPANELVLLLLHEEHSLADCWTPQFGTHVKTLVSVQPYMLRNCRLPCMAASSAMAIGLCLVSRRQISATPAHTGNGCNQPGFSLSLCLL